jgi:hypothetical protein
MLVAIPKELFGPAAAAQWGLQGGDLVIKSVVPDLSADGRKLLECQVDIFNAAGKFETFRNLSPILSPDLGPEIRPALGLRDEFGSWGPPSDFPLEMGDTDPQITTFLASRVFEWQGADLEPPTSFLVPVQDFANHHSQAPGYGADGRGSFVAPASPIAGDAECFVKYSSFDAFDGMMQFGFVDESARFLHSITTEFTLPGLGNLRTERFQKSNRQVEGSLRAVEVARSIPAVTPQPNDGMEVSRLIIPGPNDPTSLKRSITYILMIWAPDKGTEEKAELNRFIERQILRANRDYYEGLGALIAEVAPAQSSSPAIGLIRQLIDTQLGILLVRI